MDSLVRHFIGIAVAAIIVTPAVAASQKSKAVSGSILTQGPIIGRALHFSDGGIGTYLADGTYTYIGPNGKISKGRWTRQRNTFHVDFRSGRWRNDVIDPGTRTLTNSKGQTYTFR
jgi:hypothetical protein